MPNLPATRLLLIDRSSRVEIPAQPDVKALLDEGWVISRIEPRVTEKQGAQWLVAMTCASDFEIDALTPPVSTADST